MKGEGENQVLLRAVTINQNEGRTAMSAYNYNTGEGRREKVEGRGEKGEGNMGKGERSRQKGTGSREPGDGAKCSACERAEKVDGLGGQVDTRPSRAGRIQTFEDLIVWQRAVELAADVYATAGAIRDLSFRDQLQRAAVSISSNIAEGYERDSNADFVRFLYYAKGSCGEVRSQLHLARRLGLAAVQVTDRMIEQASLLSRQLGAFINVRETKFQ